jgi:cell wall-associated NlpC family hydrolase
MPYGMGARGGLSVRPRASVTVVAVAVALLLCATTMAKAGSVAPGSDLLAGDAGSGPKPFPQRAEATRTLARPAFVWADLDANDAWARSAINFVGRSNNWMRDVPPNPDGTVDFRPEALERRSLFARALVRAFVPAADRTTDPSIRFPDFPASRRLSRWANIAVKLGWMVRRRTGDFEPGSAVTTTEAHRALVYALGMRDVAAELSALSTANGYRFHKPSNFGSLVLGMRLGLRYNNEVDESQDVGPRTPLPRKQAAYSLWRAATLESWVMPYLRDQYHGIVLPNMGAHRRDIVEWGMRFAGYPYVWGGEWGLAGPEPAAFGSQPVAGFDCSGITWWTLKANQGSWSVAPPRPYLGWRLPERSSAAMAAASNLRRFDDLLVGDMAFYDGDGDRTVDHVDVYVGNGWAIDSSSSVGGVSLMWVGDGSWYRDHYVKGRRVLPAR